MHRPAPHFANAKQRPLRLHRHPARLYGHQSKSLLHLARFIYNHRLSCTFPQFPLQAMRLQVQKRDKVKIVTFAVAVGGQRLLGWRFAAVVRPHYTESA